MRLIQSTVVPGHNNGDIKVIDSNRQNMCEEWGITCQYKIHTKVADVNDCEDLYAKHKKFAFSGSTQTSNTHKLNM